MSERLRRDKGYPLGDPLNQNELVLASGDGDIRVAWTGEKRPPRKGEWYLSGAVIAAYRAPQDLSSSYHIGRLVRVEQVTVEIIHELPT